MRIGIYAFTGATMFHLSVPQMVFSEVARQGLADWQTFLFSDQAGSITTAEGYEISGLAAPDALEGTDVVVIPTWHTDGRPTASTLQTLLQATHDRGATLLGLCLGAIPIVDTGLLQGRTAVTHWQAFDLLTERHPGLTLDETVLYIDHGDVLTAAGTASGLDACLHLVRSRLGSEAANTVARSLVIAPHREGGQAQYIERPLPQHSGEGQLSQAMEWALAHLDQPLPIHRLAQAAQMSTRSFVRDFPAATGSTPAAWVKTQRLNEARRLLESTDLSIEQIANACGFGGAVTMRQNFVRAFGASPSQYRRQFTIKS